MGSGDGFPMLSIIYTVACGSLGQPLPPFSQGHRQLARPGLLGCDWIAICRDNLTVSMFCLLCPD